MYAASFKETKNELKLKKQKRQKQRFFKVAN
jgi:hypothetical protein